MKIREYGFTLIEVLVVVVIITIASAAVNLQISKSPLERARDDVRKSDINSIADAYTANAVGDNKFKPLTPGDLMGGRIPFPPEGGSYQGLLTGEQDYFFICAVLEKGKGLNCLLNSQNPNCYCRKSNGAPEPTASASVFPTSTPSPSGPFSPLPSVMPTSTPIGVGSSSPQPTPVLTPTPTAVPTPSASSAPPVYSSICPNQIVSQTKPSMVSLEGIDGSWCFDSDYSSTGGSYSAHREGYCQDNSHNCADFCEDDYPQDTVRDGYCSGTWWGVFWTNVHCEFAGYTCQPVGEACNEGNAMAYCDANAQPLPSPSPLPEEIVAKKVFKTSTIYNGNLGGLAGADQKCQARADAGNLGGVWKAWLSDGSNSASDRLTHLAAPYKLLDGVVVADDWADLTDGTLDRNINVTEFGVIDSTYSTVWTGTDQLGNSTGKNCANWSVNLGWPYYGGIGSGNSTLSYWTKGASDQYLCSANLSLYCFEQ